MAIKETPHIASADLLRPSSLAKRLGVSLATTYRLISQRKIAHYRVNGKILISADHVNQFLESREVLPNLD